MARQASIVLGGTSDLAWSSLWFVRSGRPKNNPYTFTRFLVPMLYIYILIYTLTMDDLFSLDVALPGF